MGYSDPEKQKEYNREWYKKNKEAIRERSKKYYEENKEIWTKGYEKYREVAALNRARFRAKREGLPFDITEEDIRNPGICPILGVKMERGSLKDFKTSPSVDRIIPSLGYVKGNIQVISNKANTMKSDATPEELIAFAKWVLKTFPEKGG